MFRLIIALLAGITAVGGYIPYAKDVLRGRVLPVRSTRLMFVFLLVVALFQQLSLGATLTLSVTIAETVGSIAILALSLKHGHGGLRRVDMICYALLCIDVAAWFQTGNAYFALWLSILADIIAFYPVLHKTWLDPKGETPIFYAGSTFAAVISLLTVSDLSFRVALYPVSLAVENGLEIILIYRKHFLR